MRTEFGDIDVRPGEIAVIPRGIKFQVQLHERTARGYICENYGPPLRLPTLGVIGANGLANPRDFQSPVAKFERLDEPQQLIAKFQQSTVVDSVEPFATRCSGMARQLRALQIRLEFVSSGQHGSRSITLILNFYSADLPHQKCLDSPTSISLFFRLDGL